MDTLLTTVNTPDSQQPQNEDGGWDAYWNELDERARVFREQSSEYVDNLNLAVDLSKATRVLDFGCGFGFVAREVAPRVGELLLWDASDNMRRRAAHNLRDYTNVRFLEIDPENPHSMEIPVDLVLVNSVIQYMRPDQFARWLVWWREMLQPGGSIIISDIIPPRYSSLRDYLDILRFSARRGFLWSAIVDGIRDIPEYWRMRHSRPLTRYSLSELQHYAQIAELEASPLPRNLTHFRRRMTITFTHPG